MSYGGGYNGGGYVGQSSYAGRSAQRAPTTAKKHMLKLVILGDSGYVVYNLCYCFMSIAMLLAQFFTPSHTNIFDLQYVSTYPNSKLIRNNNEKWINYLKYIHKQYIINTELGKHPS